MPASNHTNKEMRQAQRISIHGMTAWLVADHSLLGAVANMTPYGALVVGTNFLQEGNFYKISLRWDGIIERYRSYEVDVQVVWQEVIEGRQHTGLSLQPHPGEIVFLEKLIERFGSSPWD